ncbi:polysaccharide deacetylase family protein [Gammaproteobacteria bacterium]|nr:polysaccharide deacetylase family protein [Gammaproteobacteria bacterium]
MYYINPIVLHGIVNDGARSSFEDLELSLFKSILQNFKDNFLSINANLNDLDLDSNKILLTFDDGLYSDFDRVYPLVVDQNIQVICFVISEMVDKEGYLSSDNILEMSNNGVIIGSHSKNHLAFDQLSAKDQYIQFSDSKDFLQQITGSEIDNFSFPYGSHNKTSLRVGLDCGYKRLFTSRHGLSKKNNSIVPRNSINGTMSINQIDKILRPSQFTQVKWFAEDQLKVNIKKYAGDEFYKKIRKILLGE